MVGREEARAEKKDEEEKAENKPMQSKKFLIICRSGEQRVTEYTWM